MNPFKITAPHAAVIVWNYADRLGNEAAQSVDGIERTLISTLSCVSIQTSKSKGNPAGTFQLVLAPHKNWVSTITAGSWCCIMMSNKPITQANIRKADPELVKMVGKIETVRVDTVVNPADGAVNTRFLVSGTDWGHIFNNTVYVDNLIAAAKDPMKQGNAAAVALRNALFGNGNSPQSFAVKDNLSSLLNLFGNKLSGFTDAQDDVNRLAKSIYDITMPREMAEFFNFVGPSNTTSKEKVITKVLKLQTGRLVGPNTYDDKPESYGFIDPFSLQGSHTFWQVLLDNSNPALNEMYNEIVWTSNGPQLTLFNRIKPFSYKSTSYDTSTRDLRSKFTFVKTHDIDNATVVSINAGTNWRDKYNFVEVKPQFQDFYILGNWIKQKAQDSDEEAFNREGFRPLIVGTKQFPVSPDKQNSVTINVDMLQPWVKLLREWYFDTHRLLNGTIVMTGTTEYIGVGNNIRFDAGLINATPNINKATRQKGKNAYILAHVESVNHNFSVNQNGDREYFTTIQFVRGIVVDGNNALVGEGSIDQMASSMSLNDKTNTNNMISTSTSDDPDPNKLKGT